MATPEGFLKQTRLERQNRYFSEEFRRKVVNDLERKIVTIPEIISTYHVSRTAIYKWIYKYSVMKKRGKKMVIEAESDTRKIVQLKDKIKELEQTIGQKQVKIDYLEKMIELTEEDFKIKIKKKDEA